MGELCPKAALRSSTIDAAHQELPNLTPRYVSILSIPGALFELPFRSSYSGLPTFSKAEAKTLSEKVLGLFPLSSMKEELHRNYQCR